ncbi:4-hydroxy-L-threonine phosphate dehydrogenase, NAD-dependent [Roseovarius sp. EC-HK134]|uniref:4-hydroxythreonine-4-phosphate dehydrogenase n=1 Tax=Roseovarius mucosus TaxID=215743 RepID=A0A1V0RT20_9RHOB|nr:MULTISPECIES: 4-hydroxythreonine-4-phosphate dehydrogenase PdxA [Roseovarius]ARE84899.1 4-hydroxythreonine-4-phosphate dehydrogenase [Roseovarius mucosus]VVT23501.1 4-hydroxy-L-threonine phosphate dehydrogenase, NAD-dependent [Roseovarius sp. EC-SD190]VVT23679.1 4-hydroxy-L-threonine phosphate dehydrogenase, NAD-dependent [Roseovarius sp. EC-HK134]
MSAPIALSCGEPAGIGPEIAAAAWDRLRGALPFFLIGDPAHLPPGTPIAQITDPAEASAACATALPVLAHAFDGPLTLGTPNPAHARGVIDVIARGVDLVQSGAASALCTAPIHKQALQDGAGFAFPGHTEFLAHLAGVGRVVMMLASDQLRVVPTTIHIPLKDVPQALSPGLLEETIRITHAALIRDFGLSAPRLAIAGLNPHAGEGGKMGREEIEVIAPVISRLRAQGFDLRGPLSADTMFHASARATYDAAVCMYHDQALIPIKTLDFDRGVNVTLGLPFIRTSPDHGTALDIAGQGRANPTSLIEALKLAQTMGEARRA